MLDLVFLQETLGRAVEIELALCSILSGWSFVALDADGHSGGLAIGCRDGRLKILGHWGMPNVLGMEIWLPDFDFSFLSVNIYGPCQSRADFWNAFMAKDLLKGRHLLIGGDLNFSLGAAEIWGTSARIDPLTYFFSPLFHSHKLLDVNLIKAKPTWRNRRTGEEHISKRLDRFLINDRMASIVPSFRQWVGEGGNSDHFPILLELTKISPKPVAPFKFNASWLKEESYNQLFRKTWRHAGRDLLENKGALFKENLKRLKKATIEWASDRKKKQNEDLNKIDDELRTLEDPEGNAYATQGLKERIVTLEKMRAKILLEKEEEWRLKSRAIWLKAGDENTNFFHNYEKGRKNANTIWKLKDPEGRDVSSFEALSIMGKNHFKSLFSDPGGVSLAEIIRTAQTFPRFVEREETEELFQEVRKEEVESTIKSMEKDKSPGPDGWTVKLFTHFFELIGDELTDVVEESRKKGEIFSPFNATFIALIPKKEDPESFEDFRPISLCNCIYKIIAKTVAVRLKPVLSKCISPEQFGFLDGRQIHEAIGVAQETIHSIRKSNSKGAVLKIDLSKAYDRISWSYLRMLLTHLGFKVEFISWIMGCISNASFAVLINGAASQFFKSQRGLRQGCPLSPLLFLLAAEGLNRLISNAKRSGLAMPVFWVALTWIPKGILHKIKQLCSRFLWTGSKEDLVLPWVAWDKIARPKEWGGWGIKNLHDFSISLAAKSGWRLITSENLWTRVVKRKYIDPMPLEEWIKNTNKKGRHFSVIWKATVEAFKIIEQGLAWQGQAWKSEEALGIDPRWEVEWRGFLQELKRSNVRIQDNPDKLVWAHAETGIYSPKMGYSFLMKKKGWAVPDWWVKSLQKLKCPKKTKLFLWCVLKQKIPTWDVLQARFKHGPGRCPMCLSDSESIFHLFIACPFTRRVWDEVQRLSGNRFRWEGESFRAAWEFWWNHYTEKNLRNLPPILCWGIWIARNRSIFREQSTPAESIAMQSLAILSSIPVPEAPRKTGQKKVEQIREGIPWAYFDGAAQNNAAGAGIFIHINPTHSLKAAVGLGPSSNNFVELSALKLLLCWLISKNIFSVQIFGDSLNVINWVIGKYRCQNYMLRPLLDEIQSLKIRFNPFFIDHIYRDKNEEADRFSKGVQLVVDSWMITEHAHDQIRVSDLPPHHALFL
eukprot:PITA_15079